MCEDGNGVCEDGNGLCGELEAIVAGNAKRGFVMDHRR